MSNQESSPGGSLYEKRKKIYTLWVKGRFQALRNVSLTVLILFFYLVPWLEWQGRPAVWFNLPERKFFILGLTFWPQDFILLSWFLILSVFVLFFFYRGGRALMVWIRLSANGVDQVFPLDRTLGRGRSQ